MKTIDVSHLPPAAIDAIEKLVRQFDDPKSDDISKRPIPMDWLRDRLMVTSAFFDPLPDDLLELFEKGGPNDPLNRK